MSIWGQKPLNFSPFCTVLHSFVQKTCSAAKTNVIENTHPWHQNNHPWHQEEAAGATCAPFQTPEPCSIVTPDNYSFCPCTRGRHKNAAMYVHKSFAFIKTAVVCAIFCGVYMAAHIYMAAGCQFSQEKAVSQQSTENLCFK